MSTTQKVVYNNGQQAVILNSNEQVFLWNRRSTPGQITNATGGSIQYQEGKVLGRISATGKIVPFTSGASDGSQYPCGVLIGDVTVPPNTTVNIFFCDDGDVAAEKLLFEGSDTLNTAVSGQIVRDRLKLMGVKVIASTDLTGYDNF